VEALRTIPEKSADLIFADPPYNLQLRNELYRPNLSKVDAVDDGWDQFMSFEEYDEFTRSWLKESRRVLSDSGTLWVIGTYHNIFRVGAILQDLGFWILNDVAWVKTNPMPQFRGVRFCNAHETLIWAKKTAGQRKYTFNYKSLKAGNDDLQVRSDWHLPICQGRERLKDEHGKVHTTQKPEALLNRVIRACSNPGDLIVDPFLGAGTSAAVAKRLGRRYLGIERDERYVDAAIARIEAVTVAPDSALVLPDPPPPRIAFAMLLDLGLLQPGAELRLGPQGHNAVVHSDGTISSNGTRGSIHFVGARLLNTTGCNGWSAWTYFDDAAGERRPIDDLRARARQRMFPEGPGEEL
jgi:modification methylase